MSTLLGIASTLLHACDRPAAAEAPPAADTGFVSQSATGPLETEAASPRPRRAGLDAPVAWKPPAPHDPGPGALCGNAADRLDVTEVRTDATYVYFDVVHRGGSPADSHPGEPPLVYLRVDGCEAPAPRASGTVWKDWDAPSSLTMPLSALPDGELDITLVAFGASRTVSLRKAGDSVKDLPLTDRAGVRQIPAVPEFGVPAALVLPRPDCATQGGA